MTPVPRRRRVRSTIRLLVVSLLACGFGASAGLGAAMLRDADAPARTATTAPPARPALGGVRVQLLGAVLHPAVSATGRARQRARVGVRVRLTNRTARPITVPPVWLMSGRERTVADPRAAGEAAALRRPIAPRASAAGVLRYEIEGALTRRVRSQRRAALRIADRTIWTTVTIGSRARRLP